MEQHPPLPIVFEDDNYMVINKPPQLLVHRSKISKDKISVVQILKEQHGLEYIHPVHRIDRATSGVLLMSKNKNATVYATEQFMSKLTEKTYFTIIRGWPQEDSGIVDKSLKNAKGVTQEARTEYKVIYKTELPVQISKFPTSRYSLLRCRPVTGRQHQIRRHVRHLTGPIIGDTKFGKKEHNEHFKNELNCHNLLLYSAQLTINLYEEQSFTFKVDIPADLQQLCEQFAWSKEAILNNY